jgi:nicotinate-nucleotide pyrophosphorylase (carboxylating)
MAAILCSRNNAVRKQDMSSIDIRDQLFDNITNHRFAAQVHAHAEGVLSGVASLREKGEEIGVTFVSTLAEGALLRGNTVVAEFTGTPKQLALCEDSLIGLVSKYSGVATAAARAYLAGGRIRVVCGAWKKMPGESKLALRQAVTTGGLPTRLVDKDFIYLDKNYVRMLGGIGPTLRAAAGIGRRVKAIQIRGESAAIGDEAIIAVESGADVLMVDTGRVDDVRSVSAVLLHNHVRERVQLAFAGGLCTDDLARLQAEDIDIVDIGRAIVDAPLLDMSMDVTQGDEESPSRGHGEPAWS